jgi:hypothetical protein
MQPDAGTGAAALLRGWSRSEEAWCGSGGAGAWRRRRSAGSMRPSGF